MSPMRHCDGLRETGTRPLGDAERAAVARLRARLARRLAVRLALVPAVPAAAVALVALAAAAAGVEEGTAPPFLEALAVAAFVGGFVLGPAIALLSARDRWREWRDLRRDAAGSVAVEFGDGARTLSVLPASERVLARDGRPGDLRERAPVASAAPPPPSAPTYALPAGEDAGRIAEHGLVRRPLSAEEREEVRAHARGLRRIPWPFWVLAAYWLLGVGQWARGVDRGNPLPAILTVALAVGLWRLFRARALASRLDADAEEGWAIRATEGASAGDEGLPSSRLGWTARGAPASWRLRR